MIFRPFAFALLVAASSVEQGPQAPATHDPNLAERAYVAATAYHAIKRYFAHAEALPANYDFEARYRAYLAEALTAPDRRGFSLATMRLFASLGNGHTGFDDERLRAAGGGLPFRARRIEGRWTVTRSALSTLPVGTVITTIDGGPIEPWLAPIRAEIGQSSITALDRVIWAAGFLFPRRFTIGTAAGRQVAVDRANAPALPPPNATTSAIRRADGVLVIRIARFDDPAAEAAAVAAVQTAGDARAILFDLRGNGGGSTPDRLLTAVMTRPYRGTVVTTPMTLAESDAHAAIDGSLPSLPTTMVRYGPDITQPAADARAGAMGILTDGGCASACEDFVLRFKDGARGPVMGEPTFGSTGQPYVVRFPQLGMSFRVSTKREALPDGSRFEGVGVLPDVAIPLTRAELAAGTDVQLERAVATLLRPLPR